MPPAVQEEGRRDGGATFGINFWSTRRVPWYFIHPLILCAKLGIKEVVLILFDWPYCIGLINVYITVIATAAWSLTLISILLIFIRWIFLLLWYLPSSYLFHLGCWLKMGIPVLTFSFSIPQVIQLNPRAVLLQHQSYKNHRQSLSECRFWLQRSEEVWKLHFCELSYGVASFWRMIPPWGDSKG